MDDFGGAVSGGVVGTIIAFGNSLYHKFKTDKEMEEINNKLARLAQRQSNHELYAARTYVTSSDIQPIVKSIEILSVKIDNGFDKLYDQISRKADK